MENPWGESVDGMDWVSGANLAMRRQISWPQSKNCIKRR